MDYTFNIRFTLREAQNLLKDLEDLHRYVGDIRTDTDRLNANLFYAEQRAAHYARQEERSVRE